MGPEEQTILYCLSQFGTLEDEQIIRLIGKDRTVAGKIVRNLIHEQRIFQNGHTLSVLPKKEKDDGMVMAFWVLLQFMGELEPMSYYLADQPAQIFFLKNDEEYEIVSIRPGNEYIFSVIENRAKNKHGNLHYIFVTNSASLLKEFPDISVKADYALVQNGRVSFFERSISVESEV